LTILYFVLSIALLIILVLCIDDDLNDWRNHRNGVYTLECLQEYTGIFDKPEIEKLVGPSSTEDGMYLISKDQLKQLPHNWWIQGPSHLLLNILAVALVVAGLIYYFNEGKLSWLLLGCSGGYLLINILWGMTFLHFSDTEEDLEEDNESTLSAIENSITELKGELDKETKSRANSFFFKLYYKWLAKTAGNELRELEDVKEEYEILIRTYNDQLIKVQWEITKIMAEPTEEDKPRLDELSKIEIEIETNIQELNDKFIDE